ncbi:hypothetical protein [Microlunatus sp. GCM10028923]|uniref:hypothetical protein n=1 Tax=Microlunatus sp. GCM10028923 TaxID=3273400 RepID=UPI0036217EF2
MSNTVVNSAGAGLVRAVPALVGAAGFALVYLVSGSISSAFASSPAPQPNVSGEETRAWLIENATASAVQAVLMLVSVAFLALFVGAVAAITRSADGPARRWAIAAGTAAVASMIISAVLSLLVGGLAAGLTPDAVVALRTANFIAGGTAHVALFGLFALAASRIPGMSRPVRIFAIVVAVIAVGSLASLAIYYASILILAGRLLGMVWCVFAAISLARRLKQFPPA